MTTPAETIPAGHAAAALSHRARLGRWSARLIDVLTAGAAVAALALVLRREFAPPIEREPAARADEAALVGRTPDGLQITEAGRDGRLTFDDGQARLVYLFRSDCPACQRTKPTWTALADSVATLARVHALTAEDIAEGGAPASFFGSPRVRVAQVRDHAALLRELPTSYVPVTLAIDRTGKVALARIGVLTEQDVADLLRVARTWSR